MMKGPLLRPFLFAWRSKRQYHHGDHYYEYEQLNEHVLSFNGNQRLFYASPVQYEGIRKVQFRV